MPRTQKSRNSGACLSAPEYFRKKALKAFKTTTNFNEAGYLLPDGKLLNFSGGERNHRYRDHREIGEIYEATQGAAALNRFLNDGNIRIMAESPGIDISTGVEPTKEQYAAIKKFVASHGTKERQFFVDFSDVEGHRAGNYSYDGYVNADRVVNDIKYYFEHGTVREQSSIASFLRSERDPELQKVNRVLEKENAELKRDVAYLKELVKLQKQVTGGTKFTKSFVEAAAGQLIKYADAKGSKAELAPLLNSVYEYIAGGRELTWEGVREAAQPAVEWLQSHVRTKVERSAYAQDVLKDIRNSKFYLDDQQKQEVAYKYGSYNEFRKGDKKYAAKALGAVMTSVVINSLLSSLVYAMRDDDEDETFLEKYVQSFATEILDGINPITYYPFLKDVWSALQGYDIERSDMSLITSLVEKITKLVQVYSKDTEAMDEEELVEHNKSLATAWWGVTDYLTALLGIPVKNVRRDINGAFNMFSTISQDLTDRDTSWESLIDKTLENVKNAIPVVGWLPDATAADKLYKATVSGDAAYRKRLESAYSSQTSLDNAIRKGLRANDSRIWEAAMAWNNNDLEGYKRLAREIIDEGHFSQDNVVMAIQAEAKAMMPKESESAAAPKTKGYFNMDKFAVAIAQGNANMAAVIKADIIDTAVKNGKSLTEAENSFASSVSSACKDLYLDGTMSQKQAVDALAVYGGYDKERAQVVVDKWRAERETGIAYDDIDDAFLDGKISEREVQNMYMTYGGLSQEDAQEQVVRLSFVKKNPTLGDISYAAVRDYTEHCEQAGVKPKVFYDAWKYKNSLEGSVKEPMLQYIDALNLTVEQKDALYLAFGWAESKLRNAPWH